MNRIDLDELTIELFEKGISINIDKHSDQYTVELVYNKTNETIGVAKDLSPEKALSTIIRNLSFEKINKDNVLDFFDGLSKL
jgi:hypothetical protein